MPSVIDVSVVSSGHDVSDARLHRLVGRLSAAGLAVEVIGLGDPAGAPRSAVRVRTRSRRGMAGRVRDALDAPWRADGAVVLVLDPDAVPSAWVRSWGRRSLVVDVHEDYAKLLADRDWARGAAGTAARAAVGLSTSLARRADLTLVADDQVPPGVARERLVLRNLPTGDYLPAPSEPDPVPRALYVGDLRASRGLFDMVEAVAAAPGWILDLVGPVAANDEGALARRLSEADVAGRVRLHGRRPPADAWDLARGAWVGLSLLHDTPAFREGVPSKLYEYLACGLAVVASPLPRQQRIVEDSGAGVVVDPAEAGGALLAYSADRALLARHREAAAAWPGDPESAAAYEVLVDRVAAMVARAQRSSRVGSR